MMTMIAELRQQMWMAFNICSSLRRLKCPFCWYELSIAVFIGRVLAIRQFKSGKMNTLVVSSFNVISRQQQCDKQDFRLETDKLWAKVEAGLGPNGTGLKEERLRPLERFLTSGVPVTLAAARFALWPGAGSGQAWCRRRPFSQQRFRR